jgi:hypothetical protein
MKAIIFSLFSSDKSKRVFRSNSENPFIFQSIIDECLLIAPTMLCHPFYFLLGLFLRSLHLLGHRV